MNENFMKEEPVLPLITSMALPMVINFNGAAHGYQHDGELAVQHCG